MGWNHHLVLFIMIHPPFEASWGHVFVITLLLSSTDIITYTEYIFCEEIVPSTLTIQNPKKNTTISKKHPPVGGTTSPRCVLFHSRFPHFFLPAKAVNDVTRSMESYDSTLKTCQTRQRREGAKEGHDIYPVDVMGPQQFLTVSVVNMPSGELTYPTLGKLKSSSKCHFWGIC